MKRWDPNFGPSYTPKEMLDLGIFEGVYTGVIKGIPAEYKNHPKVLPKGSEPDVELNRYKVKSRQSLKEWERKGWTTKLSPLGWWEWYIKYYHGRRDDKEDKLQISRWRSFVARHQGQINANCKPKDDDCRPKQRQGLLQWAWDSSEAFTPKQIEENAKRIAKSAGVEIDSTIVAQEHTHKSTTYVYLHSPSGMSLEDAIFHAEEIGDTGLGVVGVGVDTVPYDNVVYFTKDELSTALDALAVVYVGYPLSQKEIAALNKKYTVCPTDTQSLDEHEG